MITKGHDVTFQLFNITICSTVKEQSEPSLWKAKYFYKLWKQFSFLSLRVFALIVMRQGKWTECCDSLLINAFYVFCLPVRLSVRLLHPPQLLSKLIHDLPLQFPSSSQPPWGVFVIYFNVVIVRAE